MGKNEKEFKNAAVYSSEQGSWMFSSGSLYLKLIEITTFGFLAMDMPSCPVKVQPWQST